MKLMLRVAQNKSGRASSLPDEIATSMGHTISQKKRECIEHGIGWREYIAPIRQVKVRSVKKVGPIFTLTKAVYYLLRMCALGQFRRTFVQ